jgi:hypothetical protein
MYLATERYLKLMRNHPRTLEGHQAKEALLIIAQTYEAEGKRYHALSIYEKVAAVAALEERIQRAETMGVRDASGAVGGRARQGIQERKGGPERHREMLQETPFVDLSEETHMVRNFERLGRIRRMRAETLHQAVESLTKLKG